MNKNDNEATIRPASTTPTIRPWPENCPWPDPREQKYGLKIKASVPSPVKEIEKITGIYFSNDHLLRQAFTRRAFGLEYSEQQPCEQQQNGQQQERRHHVLANSEVLEFIGDTILNAVVTQEMMKKFAKVDGHSTTSPFVTAPKPIGLSSVSSASTSGGTEATACGQTEGAVDTKTVRSARSVRPLDEGDFTKIRNLFISKEYLSSQAVSLSLDRFILYGSNEKPSASAREDMMEALIGAVAMDSDWDWSVIRKVTKRLLNLNKRLDSPSTTETATASSTESPDGLEEAGLLASVFKESYFDLFNNWHQRRWGCMPTYNVGLVGSYAHDYEGENDAACEAVAKNADSSQINTVSAADADDDADNNDNNDADEDEGSQDGNDAEGRAEDRFYCDLTYFLLKHSTWSGSYEKKEDSAWATGETKAKAREAAAEIAYNEVKKAGLLERDISRDSGIEPNLEDAVNQIQELKQKKYLKEFSYNYFSHSPDHQSADEEVDGRNGGRKGSNKGGEKSWLCSCYCSQPFNSILGCGQDKSKRVAKKMAALDALNFLFKVGSSSNYVSITASITAGETAGGAAGITNTANTVNTQRNSDTIIGGAEKLVLMVHLKGDNMSNDIYRLFSAPDTATLDDVCDAILDSFDFDHDHLYTFSLRGETYLSQEADLDEPWTTWITLKELRHKNLLKVGDCMILHYDFGDNWRFVIGVRSIAVDPDTITEVAGKAAVETSAGSKSAKKSKGGRKKTKQPIILLKSQGELQQYPDYE